MEKLKNSGAIVTTQNSINGKNSVTAKLKQTNYVNDTNDVVLNLRVFITGDLAFYAAVLGKVNMAGNWCNWCDLRRAEWIKNNHTAGEWWTLEKMKQVRDDIADGVLTNTSNNKKGCVDEPLINCIEPISYIPPILHIMIGMLNKALDECFKWVDCMVEEILVKERSLRNEFTNANNRLRQKKKTTQLGVTTTVVN